MRIETVKVKKSIKAGDLVYLEGEIFNAPDIPKVIMDEVRHEADTVEVIDQSNPPRPQVKHNVFDYVSVPEMKTSDLSTASTIKMREQLEKQMFGKPKKVMIRRKKPKMIKRQKK